MSRYCIIFAYLSGKKSFNIPILIQPNVLIIDRKGLQHLSPFKNTHSFTQHPPLFKIFVSLLHFFIPPLLRHFVQFHPAQPSTVNSPTSSNKLPSLNKIPLKIYIPSNQPQPFKLRWNKPKLIPFVFFFRFVTSSD